MNILTDILSLFKRNKFVKEALPNDVLVLGLNQEPDMTGVASPIPYKSVRLIKLKDLSVAVKYCDHVNTPQTPASNSGTVFQKTNIDPLTEKCTVYYRTLRSLSTNLTLANSADNDYVEISTTGEPNTAANVGTGIGVWKNKVGETLNFKTLIAGSNIAITESLGLDEITISSTSGTSDQAHYFKRNFYTSELQRTLGYDYWIYANPIFPQTTPPAGMIPSNDWIGHNITDPSVNFQEIGGLLLNASLYSGPKTHCKADYRDLCKVTVRVSSNVAQFQVMLYKTATLCQPLGTQKDWDLISSCNFTGSATATDELMMCCEMDLTGATTNIKRFDTDDALMLVVQATGGTGNLGFMNGEISFEMQDGSYV